VKLIRIGRIDEVNFEIDDEIGMTRLVLEGMDVEIGEVGKCLYFDIKITLVFEDIWKVRVECLMGLINNVRIICYCGDGETIKRIKQEAKKIMEGV